MYLTFTSSKDTYITNKIINASTRATDANVGVASTLDLFKLYNESTLSGSAAPIELSRALIYFNLSDISASLKDKVSFDYFTASLKLHDVLGNNVAPSNFNLIVYPVAKTWDEGMGRDVYSFGDLDRANWITSSFSSNTNATWNTAGANAEGALGSNDIDVIGSGSIAGGSLQFLYSTQFFDAGNEDLEVDVTTFVSASMTGFADNHGFLIAFSGSEETDSKTRFVKRFASRHTKNPFIVPKLIFEWQDHIQDRHANMEFNESGSLFLNNFYSNSPSNLVSGSSLTSITGSNSVLLKLHTGSWQQYFTGSQCQLAGIHQTGVYKATFAIDSFASASVNSEDTLSDFINASGSVVFGEEWLSLDENVSYFTGSIKISSPKPIVGSTYRDLRFKVLDLKSEYKKRGDAKIRLFVRDRNEAQDPVRIPVRLPSLALNEVYYRIKEANTGEVLVPFGQSNNSTRVSSDASGMFFNLPLSVLPLNRIYTIELLVVERGNESIFETNVRFKVVS